MKRILIKVLVCCLLICPFVYLFSACEEKKEKEIEPLITYELNEEKTGYIVKTSSFDKSDIIIPDTYNDLPVVEIGKGALSSLALKSVVIPASVKVIGKDAFRLSGLTSVSFGENSQLETIGDSAFSGCAFSSITLPNGLKSIGKMAFDGCKNLKDITIPNSVTSIGAEAFGACAFTSITIPNSVTVISYNMFYGCEKLTSITIHDGVTEIQSSTFHDCTALTSINIPASVTKIGEEAFAGCTALTSATFVEKEGWKAGSTPIPSADLNNAETAAQYLTSDWNWNEWTRSAS